MGPQVIVNAVSIWDHADHQYGQAVVLERFDFPFALSTSVQTFQASDPRDHIFGLLGLATFSADSTSLPSLLTPDYNKTTEEVFRDATLFVIQVNRSLWPLSVAWHRNSLDDVPFSTQRPSWVPDYDRIWDPNVDAAHLETTLFNAGGELSQQFDIMKAAASPGILELQGIVIDHVQEVGALWVEIEGIRKLYEQCSSMAASHAGYTNERQRTSAIVSTLHGGATYESTCACGKCSPEFAFQFMSVLQKLKEGEEPPDKVQYPVI